MLFDSHAHLDDAKFDRDREDIINQLKKDGVTNLINIGADMESSIMSVEIANKYDFIYASVGFHPCDADLLTDERFDKLVELAKDKKVVAIGETGLDYHWDNVSKRTQKESFIKHINLAKEFKMPVIVHDREAHKDIIDILSTEKPENAIIHCYSGSLETAKSLVKMGYYISFAGTITFKNAAKLINVAKYVPSDRLLIETDCPYLAPEPVRGTRNYCGNVRFVAQKIAEIRGTTYEEIARITDENAKRVYNIKEV